MKLRGIFWVITIFLFTISLSSVLASPCSMPQSSDYYECWISPSTTPAGTLPSLNVLSDTGLLMTFNMGHNLPLPPTIGDPYFSSIKYVQIYEKELESRSKRLSYVFYEPILELPEYFEVWESDSLYLEPQSQYDNAFIKNSLFSPTPTNLDTYYGSQGGVKNKIIEQFPGYISSEGGILEYFNDKTLIPRLIDDNITRINSASTSGSNPSKFVCSSNYCVVDWFPSIEEMNRANKYCTYELPANQNSQSKCLNGSNYFGEGLYEFYMVPKYNSPKSVPAYPFELSGDLVFKKFGYYEYIKNWNYLFNIAGYSGNNPMHHHHILFVNVSKGPYLDSLKFDWRNQSPNGIPINSISIDFNNLVSGGQTYFSDVILNFSGFPSYYYGSDIGVENYSKNEGASSYTLINSLSTPQQSLEQVSNSGTFIQPWKITYSDILAAGNKSSTLFYVKIKTLIDEKEFFETSNQLNVTIVHPTGITTLGSLTSDWMKDGQGIDSFVLNTSLSSSAKTVQINVPGVEFSSGGGATGNVIGNPIIYGFPSAYYGQQIQVDIYYTNSTSEILIKSINGTVTNNGALTVNWEITEQDLSKAGHKNNYVFYYKIKTHLEVRSFPDKTLNVSVWRATSYNLNNAQGEWRVKSLANNISSFNFNSGTSNEVALYVSGIQLPSGINLVFEIYEKDSNNADDEIRVGTNALTATFNSSTGIAHAVWNMTSEDVSKARDCSFGTCDNGPWEFYFKVIDKTNSLSKTFDSKILKLTNEAPTDCIASEIFFCSAYKSQQQCNSDFCNVSGRSSPSGINCSIVDCGCTWNFETQSCKFSYSAGGIGNCKYQENQTTQNNCDEDGGGSIEYFYKAIWEWASDNPKHVSKSACESANSVGTCVQSGIYWYYDPTGAYLSCSDISGSYNCPAKAKLPGFNWINLLIAFILVSGIYFLRRK